MTLGIATFCDHENKFAVVLCADWQGTRGDFIKVEDTYKIQHFERAAILIAGDPSTAYEFACRFQIIVREFNSIQKTRGDVDIRTNTYLARLREIAASFKRDRANHAIAMKFAITLDDFYSKDAPQKFTSEQYKEISDTIKNTDLGAEFIVVYMDEEEPVMIRIYQNGDVALQEGPYVAIGTGEPFAESVLSSIDITNKWPTLAMAISYVYEAKLAAQRNPFVGETTTISVMLADGKEYDLSDELWNALKQKHEPLHIPTVEWSELKKPPLIESSRDPLKGRTGRR